MYSGSPDPVDEPVKPLQPAGKYGGLHTFKEPLVNDAPNSKRNIIIYNQNHYQKSPAPSMQQSGPSREGMSTRSKFLERFRHANMIEKQAVTEIPPEGGTFN